MKDRIIERLLSEGHITIQMADIIINNKGNKAEIIADLKHDSIITSLEAVILLRDNEAYPIPFEVPHQTFPIMPTMPWQPYNPGNPYWHVTCTMDPGFNRD